MAEALEIKDADFDAGGRSILNAPTFNRRKGFIMRQGSLGIGIVAIACVLLAQAAPVHAAAGQTWVSGTGTDAGATCPISAPCRTFQYAHNQTNSGGTIYVLSSGIFGALTISKSISIVADGVEAAIHTTAGSTAITINTPGVIVYLRGLTIDVSGANVNGIYLLSGAALHVQNSLIRRATTGIRFAPASGTSELYVTDSVVADTISVGIHVRPNSSGSARAWLDRVRVENGVNGIIFSGLETSGTVVGTVRDNASVGNSSRGIIATNSISAGVNVTVDRSAFINNGTGILVDNNALAILRIGDSTVSGNAIGLATAGGGVIQSFGTNKILGNTTDGVTPTPVALK